MKRFHIIIMFLVALCSPFVAMANQLSGSEALLRAGLAKKSGLKGATAFELVKTVSDDAGHNLYYVYSNPFTGRLYFLSADDCGRAVLGYTEQSVDLEADSFPQPLNELLDFYGKEISYGIAHPDSVKPFGQWRKKTSRLKSFETDFPSIPVLLPYEWGTIPFNSQCPLVDTFRTKCGCVALAMFQIMNYWQYPAKGRDTVVYTAQVEGVDTVLSLDLNNSVYNWQALTDLTTEEGIAAAGILGRDCAYTLHATFGINNTSARTSRIPGVMVRYFDYDSSLVCIGRSDDDEMWFRILYNELENGRPVVYAASGSYGHAFVCDGFNSADTTFHFNWSWYGKYNGYYSLSALTPGNDVFDESHMMVIGIQPPNTFVKGSDHVYAYGDLTIDPYLEDRVNCHTLGSLAPTSSSDNYASKGIFFAPPIYPTSQVGMQLIKDGTTDTVMLILNYGSMIKKVAAFYDYVLFSAYEFVNIDNNYKFLSTDTSYTISLFYRDFADENWRSVLFPSGASASSRFRITDNGNLVSADASISPLVKTSWNEDWLNSKCPRWYGNYCSAGYDAVAVGQITYALKAPSKVFFPLRYDSLSIDSDYVFLFEDDHVTYDIPYFGKAIRTSYKLHSTLHSPAAMVYGLHKNMGLPNVQYASRRFYTSKQWFSLLDQQLKKGCPVYYSAYSIHEADSTRRAFVVDGFDEGHSYHINFGDGGEGDKYTDLNVIVNSGSTPGNTDKCFPYGQAMLLDYFTDCEIDSVNLPSHPFMLMSPLVVNGDSTLTSLSLAVNETAEISFRLADCTEFESEYDASGSYQIAVGVYNGESLRRELGTITLPVTQLSGTLSFALPTLNNGSYELALVTSTDGGTTWERVFNNAQNSIPITNKRGQYTLSIPFNPTFGADLALYDSVMEVVDDSVKGQMVHLPLVNSTESNYEDVLRIVVKTSATDSVVYDAQMVAVYGNSLVNYDIILPTELKTALAAGGQIQGYYYKVGAGWLPLLELGETESINSVLANVAQGPVSVYTPNGVCIKHFANYSTNVDAYLKSLSKGVYVITSGSQSNKIVVR